MFFINCESLEVWLSETPWRWTVACVCVFRRHTHTSTYTQLHTHTPTHPHPPPTLTPTHTRLYTHLHTHLYTHLYTPKRTHTHPSTRIDRYTILAVKCGVHSPVDFSGLHTASRHASNAGLRVCTHTHILFIFNTFKVIVGSM